LLELASTVTLNYNSFYLPKRVFDGWIAMATLALGLALARWLHLLVCASDEVKHIDNTLFKRRLCAGMLVSGKKV